jgi:Ca-activated chloride channel homolog
MIDFEWPWMLLLLPLPLLVRWLAPPTTTDSEAALRVPFLDEFEEQSGRRLGTRSAGWFQLLAVLAWILLIIAAMRPQWLGDFIEFPVSGRDLMLAVDLSGSMQEEDFILNGRRVDRLTALKSVAVDFIDRRIGDRIGLILFGDRAYLQAPLTLDRESVKIFLSESFIGLPGRATAIGDAIGLAVKRLREREDANRVLILLTDGANTAGEVDPIEAARLASREGMKIYTIGIGADEMVVQSFFGTRKVNPSVDLDEKTMTTIAEMTGGQYFRARDTRDFERIYAILDELEPIERDVRRFRPKKNLYFWPLSLAFLIAASLLIYNNSRRVI